MTYDLFDVGWLAVYSLLFNFELENHAILGIRCSLVPIWSIAVTGGCDVVYVTRVPLGAVTVISYGITDIALQHFNLHTCRSILNI